jgi:hypothetical protein
MCHGQSTCVKLPTETTEAPPQPCETGATAQKSSRGKDLARVVPRRLLFSQPKALVLWVVGS